MKKLMVAIVTVLCLVGFNARSFADEKSQMTGEKTEMKGEMKEKTEMKGEMKETKKKMKKHKTEMKGEMMEKKDEMKGMQGEMKGGQ